MTKTVTLPDNFIGKDDKVKLESFGGHTIAHGRATRWHWAKNGNGDDIFEIYIGGAHEMLNARIFRDRKQDIFCARDGSDNTIAAGVLEHVLAKLDNYFIRTHDTGPDIPA